MWVSKRQWDRLTDRIERLESELRAVKRKSGGISVNTEGLLYQWDGAETSVIDALNAMAKRTGFKWKQVYAQPATIEAAE